MNREPLLAKLHLGARHEKRGKALVRAGRRVGRIQACLALVVGRQRLDPCPEQGRSGGHVFRAHRGPARHGEARVEAQLAGIRGYRPRRFPCRRLRQRSSSGASRPTARTRCGGMPRHWRRSTGCRRLCSRPRRSPAASSNAGALLRAPPDVPPTTDLHLAPPPSASARSRAKRARLSPQQEAELCAQVALAEQLETGPVVCDGFDVFFSDPEQGPTDPDPEAVPQPSTPPAAIAAARSAAARRAPAPRTPTDGPGHRRTHPGDEQADDPLPTMGEGAPRAATVSISQPPPGSRSASDARPAARHPRRPPRCNRQRQGQGQVGR